MVAGCLQLRFQFADAVDQEIAAIALQQERTCPRGRGQRAAVGAPTPAIRESQSPCLAPFSLLPYVPHRIGSNTGKLRRVRSPLTKLPGRGHHSAPRRATLALLAFAQLIVAIDAYIVVIALPDIGRELGFSDQTLQTVISAYAVAFGGFLLLGGRAADLLGRRRMFIAGLFLYAISSLAGGLAGAPEILLGARVVQEIGRAHV